jgi:hypothetical protein
MWKVGTLVASILGRLVQDVRLVEWRRKLASRIVAIGN